MIEVLLDPSPEQWKTPDDPAQHGATPSATDEEPDRVAEERPEHRGGDRRRERDPSFVGKYPSQEDGYLAGEEEP